MTRILVGAPQARGLPSQGANHTGALYQCPITGEEWDCERVDIDEDVDLERESKENQWLGVTVKSQGVGGKVVACAHLYELRQRFRQPSETRDPIGRCYVLSEDLTVRDDLDGGEWKFCEGRPQGHEQFGFCQQGMAAGFTPDNSYILFGAPGTYHWKGELRLQLVNLTGLDRGVFDDGPYEVADEKLQDSRLIPLQYNSYLGLLFMASPVEDALVYRTLDPSDRGTSFEDVAQNSYLGFSVDSAHGITSPQELSFVAGAPRANHRGAVVLLKKDNVYRLVPEHILWGSEVASSFGYSVAVADLNNDGWTDLVVGAPNVFDRKAEIGGAVYVYINPSGLWKRAIPVRLNGTYDSMFGLTVTSVGDLNQDGFADIAVGAPFDGDGKVYIYHGSASGINTKPAQVLDGEGVGVKLFGYSLSGGMDIDGNSYPDLVVGSLSDSVVLYRARPVIHVLREISVQPQNIDLEQKNCRGRDGVCTNKQTKPASSPQRQRVEATRGRSTSGKSTAQLEAERRNYIFNYIFNIWSCFIWSCFNQKHCSLKPCSCVYFSDNKLKLGAADSNPAVFWDTGEGRSPQHKQTNKASQHSQRLRVEATRGRSTSGKSTAQLEAERRNYIFNIWSCFIWSCFNQKHCSLKPCSCVYFSDNKLKLGAADSNPAVFWDTGEGRSPQHKQTKPASIHSDGVWKRRVGEVRVEKDKQLVCAANPNGSYAECELGNPMKRNGKLFNIAPSAEDIGFYKNIAPSSEDIGFYKNIAPSGENIGFYKNIAPSAEDIGFYKNIAPSAEDIGFYKNIAPSAEDIGFYKNIAPSAEDIGFYKNIAPSGEDIGFYHYAMEPFSSLRLTMQPPKSYSVGGQHSSPESPQAPGQTPGRWCAVSRGPPGRPKLRNLRSEVTFYIILSTSAITIETTDLTVNLQLLTISEQPDLQPIVARARVVIELPLSVTGMAVPHQLFFSGTTKGESAMTSQEDVGSAVEYKFTVTNPGQSLQTLGSAFLNVMWPHELSNGKWLLYPTGMYFKGDRNTHCSTSQPLNPLRLTDYHNLPGQTDYHSRKGRSNQEKSRIQTQGIVGRTTPAVSASERRKLLTLCGFFKRAQYTDTVPQYHAVKIPKQDRPQFKDEKTGTLHKKEWATHWSDRDGA
ncbi:UNVERIFIED_CONTAM: hypothetical protein FKN15_057780 [Acipenser sinensis]